MPAVVWGAGVPPNTRFLDLASTMDIYATAASLAGVPLPAGEPIDGKDLSGVLFNGAPSPHQAYFFYRGQDEVLANGTLRPGCWAARVGPYKAHWITKSGYGTDEAVFHDPPLLFQVNFDPSERWPLNTSDPTNAAILAQITAARDAHRATVPLVENLCGMVNMSVAVCCDEDSKSKFPMWPKCTCNPENY